MAVNIEKQLKAVLEDTDFIENTNKDFSETGVNIDVSTILQNIISNRGNLRSTRPKHCGYSSYVWRMVAFAISDNRQHYNMPIMVDFYVNIENHDLRRKVCAILDSIENRIVAEFKVSEQPGTTLWGKSLGFI